VFDGGHERLHLDFTHNSKRNVEIALFYATCGECDRAKQLPSYYDLLSFFDKKGAKHAFFKCVDLMLLIGS